MHGNVWEWCEDRSEAQGAGRWRSGAEQRAAVPERKAVLVAPPNGTYRPPALSPLGKASFFTPASKRRIGERGGAAPRWGGEHGGGAPPPPPPDHPLGLSLPGTLPGRPGLGAGADAPGGRPPPPPFPLFE